jgi:hypothetical protein
MNLVDPVILGSEGDSARLRSISDPVCQLSIGHLILN